MSGYVCAFRGRRDDYQVPLALEEAGRLDQLITDAYAGPWLLKLADALPARVRATLRFRQKEGLSARHVRSLWGATLLEHLRHRTGYSRAATYARIDRRYSEAAAARARATRSHLLLYSPYAWEAFTARYAHTPHRVLFQFHPHAAAERRILQEDVKSFPEIARSYEEEVRVGVSESLCQREEACWQPADRIICASTFTRTTLAEAGADVGKCLVAPYGIEVPATSEPVEEKSPAAGFHALFVGSGVQRKGLHHLLHAWKNAALPVESSLTLVCRVLDPGLRERVARTPRVRWLPGVSREELSRLYRRSTLFAMPSLVEGFGQVYLEALAHGCPVLGTTHTCLPDLGTEADGIFLTRVANIDDLVHQLEDLSRRLPAEPDVRRQARAVARKFTWSKFRAGVIAQL